LSTGDEVRYIGINTPEIENNDCYATEAAKANSDLVLGKSVTLVKDASETDKYGRLLRYVYTGDTFINDELVKNGCARVMSISPDIKFESTFLASEKFAKDNLLGFWRKCSK
jgi:micrococcal nuclease